MTTTITVTTVDRTVAVTERSKTEGKVGHNVNETVTTLGQPNQAQTFIVRDGVSLIVEEVGDFEAAAESVDPVVSKQDQADRFYEGDGAFMKTGGSARPITDEDIARTNNAG